jgi:hypothetical protein
MRFLSFIVTYTRRREIFRPRMAITTPTGLPVTASYGITVLLQMEQASLLGVISHFKTNKEPVIRKALSWLFGHRREHVLLLLVVSAMRTRDRCQRGHSYEGAHDVLPWNATRTHISSTDVIYLPFCTQHIRTLGWEDLGKVCVKA